MSDAAGGLAEARAEIERLRAELDSARQEVVDAYDELERTNQGVVALYAEIDEKNQQLRSVTAAKTRFLRSISHELRTPVNSILGLTRLLLEPGDNDRLSEDQHAQVDFIRTSAADLLRLVEELMDLAKAESGRLEPTVVETSLEAVFADLGQIVEPLLRDGVHLVVEVDGPDRVHTDPALLRHVLRNLLSNAAKFTTSGSITLSAHTDTGTDRWVVAVSDTGVGISPEDQERIFEEFFQAPSPLQVGTRGTGLGLAFAQLVARTLGGTIEVESQVGTGSTFRLALPVAPPDLAATAPEVTEMGGEPDA